MINQKSMHTNRYIIKRDLINKLNYQNIGVMPYLFKAHLNAGIKGGSLELLASSALIIEFMTGRAVSLKKCKAPNLHLKMKKGSPAGVALNFKKAELNIFLSNLLAGIIPGIKNFSFNLKKDTKQISFTFKREQIINFLEVKQTPDVFKNIKSIDISITIKNGSNFLEPSLLFSPVLI